MIRATMHRIYIYNLLICITTVSPISTRIRGEIPSHAVSDINVDGSAIAVEIERSSSENLTFTANTVNLKKKSEGFLIFERIQVGVDNENVNLLDDTAEKPDLTLKPRSACALRPGCHSNDFGKLYANNGVNLTQLIGREIPCERQIPIEKQSKTAMHMESTTKLLKPVVNIGLRIGNSTEDMQNYICPYVYDITTQNQNANHSGFYSSEIILHCQLVTEAQNLSNTVETYKIICISFDGAKSSQILQPMHIDSEKNPSSVLNTTGDLLLQTPNPSRIIQIISWTREGYLLSVNLSWDFSTSVSQRAEDAKDLNFLLTWEILGGGLTGNLVTDENSTVISLAPETVYIVQVSILGRRGEVPAKFDQIGNLLGKSELGKTESSASIFVNTSELIGAKSYGHETETSYTDLVDDPSAKIHELTDVNIIENQIEHSHSDILIKSAEKQLPLIQLKNSVNDFENAAKNLSTNVSVWTTMDFSKVAAPGSTKARRIPHFDEGLMASTGTTVESDNIVFRCFFLICTGIVLVNCSIFFWLKFKRHRSKQCSVATITEAFLNCNHGCAMKVPLVQCDTCNLAVTTELQISKQSNHSKYDIFHV